MSAESALVTYARQRDTSNKSRVAILAGAKLVIAKVGNYQSNIADIAVSAQVAKATIYNQFADKAEMMESLVESEVIRLTELALAASSRQEGLALLSNAISQDLALRKLVESDPSDIARLVTITNHPTWVLVHQGIAKVFGADSAACGVILRWLIGQIASPITEEESVAQARRLAASLFN
ncbi:TetR transcriptional regulator [Candidatus Nanopelagicus abundans]|uniref:TetR transcriptional regulator n=1 Tax=Candidatus Nanopelagicus abundans TaxID=1884916 RepID=A0A249L549_9ACTN|nr:TetR family transcriptional regulator [Candidatus Nanopelagicus abundans]ASY24055.1 TetR transcriptional regulator [Candidatus Nanopelagicus abundans]